MKKTVNHTFSHLRCGQMGSTLYLYNTFSTTNNTFTVKTVSSFSTASNIFILYTLYLDLPDSIYILLNRYVCGNTV